LKAASTTISRFVARLEPEEVKPRKTKPLKEKPVPIMPIPPEKPMPQSVVSADEIRQRIAALKQRQSQPEPETRRFDYDPDRPLHLILEHKKDKKL
jgi:hypothetical protein